MRSCHPVWSHLNGIPTGHLHFIMLSAGQGRDRQPAQVRRRSHTHQNRVKSRKEAVQALGRNVGLLVSITEPLHRRNAEKRKGPSQERERYARFDLQAKPSCPRPFVGTCRSTPGHYSTTLDQIGSTKVNVNFSWPVQGNISLTLLLHTSQV